MAERYWEDWWPPLRFYVVLFHSFTEGRLTAGEFETLFLAHYKADATDWSPKLFDVLDTVFGAVDEYVPDEALRAAVSGLNEAELHDHVARGLQQLQAQLDEEESLS